MTHHYHNASIGTRFFAFLIDRILIGGVICVYLFFSMGTASDEAFIDEGTPSLADKYQFFAYADGIVNGPDRTTFFESFVREHPGPAIIGLFLIPLIYYVFFETLWGGTIGKLLTGIRVRRKDGGKIGIGTSIVRFIGRNISGLIFMLGYILALFDRKRQALHDKIANTLVIKKGTGIN